MKSSRYKLTPEIERSIVSFILAGGFADVAAEAAGIPREVFERWCRKGEQAHAAPRYRAFALAVRKAVAQARLGAEVSVRKDKPLDWLRGGPGRETADRTGWTANARARSTAAAVEASVFSDPQALALVSTILDAIELAPEKRELIAGMIARGSGA